MKKLSLLLLLTVLLALSPVSPALAEEPLPTPSADEVNAIAKNMYCPVCENIPLDVCGTAACAQWRQQIADLLAQGYSEQEIYDYFVLQYGDRVLAEPPRRGLNWLVYVVPPVAILAGAVLLVFYMRNMRKPTPAAVGEIPAAPKADDEYLSRLEEELKKRL